MRTPLVIGSRGSDLALWQARHVQELLAAKAGVAAEIRIIRTQGDTIDHLPFEKMEGKGFFTKEIEDALLKGEIDVAVHSLKDLPTDTPQGLVVGAIPTRADARDVLLIAGHAHDPDRMPLPVRGGARVGTSAARRKAQLRARRPDLTIDSLRGNVPTRVRKLREGVFDAIVLAAAGMERLGLDLFGLTAIVLEPEVFTPAPGQGALAIEARAADREVLDVLRSVHDPILAEVIATERSLLRHFGGGCSLPLGACLRSVESGPSDDPASDLPAPGAPRYRLDAFWAPPDHSPPRWVSVVGHEPARLAADAHAALLDHPLRGKRIVITRPAADEDPLAHELRALGADVIAFPVIGIAPFTNGKTLSRALDDLGSFDWVVFPSAHAVSHFADRLTTAGRALPSRAQLAAVGPGTAREVAARFREPDLVPSPHVSEALLDALLANVSGERRRFLIPSAREGRETLAEGLAGAGHDVVKLPVYETVPTPRSELDPAAFRGADAVLFASPSAAQRFLEVASVPEGARVITIGPVTTEAIRARGLRVDAEADPHTVEGLIACLLNG